MATYHTGRCNGLGRGPHLQCYSGDELINLIPLHAHIGNNGGFLGEAGGLSLFINIRIILRASAYCTVGPQCFTQISPKSTEF